VTDVPLLLVGAGGHAVACIDVIEREGRFDIGGLVASAQEVGKDVLGYKVIGTDADLRALHARFKHAFIVVGQIKSAQPRVHLFGELEASGYELPAIISPRAYVSSHAMVGRGTIVMHGAIVNAGARIGDNCIINSNALVEHDAIVGDHCHVSTAVSINGGTRVGSQTFLGSGCVLREGITVGERCIVGMGQRVLGDCQAGTRIAGETDA
jgi:sugar O-acyltransferase (sialic acid O-acetyltransferase NeuD family)